MLSYLIYLFVILQQCENVNLKIFFLKADIVSITTVISVLYTNQKSGLDSGNSFQTFCSFASRTL